jgi:hypothetical protein
MQQPNRIEMGILKLIIARLKSKSPAMYATLTKLAGIAATIMGAYIIIYNSGIMPAHWVIYGKIDTGIIDNTCIVLGAAATSLGLVSATTTLDPTLLSPEVKQNVLNEAVDNGTHIPCVPAQQTKSGTTNTNSTVM